MTVGRRIAKKRKELGLTQEELAKKLGYTSRSAISNVEKDKEDLTTTRVRRFAEVLGVSPCYLMGWDENISLSNEEKSIVIAYRKQPDAVKDFVCNALGVQREKTENETA